MSSRPPISPVEGALRVAWLGEDGRGLDLLRALLTCPTASLVAAAECATVLAELTGINPRLEAERDAASLLLVPLDAAVVAGASESVLAGARRLAQQGIPVLVDPSSAPAFDLFSELTALDVERPLPIVPAFRQRGLPEVQALGAALTANELGGLLRVRWERRSGSGTEGLTPEASERALLEDVDLLRGLVGRFDQVTAFRHIDSAGRMTLATANLVGAGVPPVFWSWTHGEEGWHLTVEGERQTAVVEVDPGGSRFVVQGRVVSETSPSALANAAVGPVVCGFLRQLPSVVASAPWTATMTRPPLATWTDFIRAVEILDAAVQSVRRRRTIDVLSEAPSERGLFKSQMTALGCVMLLLTPLGVVLYLMLAAALDLPGWLKTALVVLVFLPLGLFLMLQGLLFLAHPPPREDGPPTAGG